MKLCQAIIPISVVTDQTVFAKNDIGHEMYFVIRGEVEVNGGKSGTDRLGYIGQDGFFGEKAIIESIRQKYGSGGCIRTRSVRATVDTDLAMLSGASINDISTFVSCPSI